MKKLNVLVTGCGGDIGQSICKILKKTNFIGQIIGIDIHDKTPAIFIYPHFEIGLPCSDDNYLVFLENIVSKYKIDILIPISEFELRFFHQNGITNNIGTAKMIIASSEVLTIGFDKYLTAKFLETEGLPFPHTEKVNSELQLDNFPLIFKSCNGSGSKNIFILENQFDYEYYSKKYIENFIVQEYLSDSNGEYTCGLFRGKKGDIRTIIIKRELHGGYTGYGEVVENSLIENLLIKISTKLNLLGSMNVQLRLTEKGPVIFEINPRFSSTIYFRYLFGFNDLIWSIQDCLNLDIDNYFPNAVGRKLYKGFEEYTDLTLPKN